MKFKVSKKLIVSSLASVMAVSLVGAVTGTVAWYQYNTRATTSLVGLNAGETGILELSADGGTTWKRDITSADILTASGRTDFSLTPMTFAGGNMTADGALPLVESALKGYKNPDKSSKTVVENGSDYSTRGSYASNWDVATAANDYIQYTLQMRAKTVNNDTDGYTQTAEKVYITDFVLAKIGTADITDAMRIHLAIDANGDGDYADAGDGYALVSKTAVADLALHGMLDQDDDGIADRIGGYEWAEHRSDHIDYGKGNDYTQTTAELSTKVATRDANGNISGQDGKILLTTPTTGVAKITITIWVEGWDTTLGTKTVHSHEYAATTPAPTVGTSVVTSLFEQYSLNGTPVANNYVQSKGDADGKAVDGVTYYTLTDHDDTEVADWTGESTEGAMFQFGITFDVGRNAFAD